MSCFKSNEDVDKLLEHKNNGSKRIAPEVKNKVNGSGNHGNHDRSDKRSGEQKRTASDKADVGVLAEIIGNKAAGTLLDVGQTQVSQYKHGKNGSNKTDIKLIGEMDERLGKIEDKVVSKVDLFLEMIAEEKVLELPADKLAGSAEKMVNTLDKLRRRNEKQENRARLPQIVITGPAMINMEEFITKEV